MAYVQQICEGYNKKTLMGNWQEERIYPEQPFRQQASKAARSKDEGITCLDGTGFQRALPRLERRSKWETANRIILDDGVPMKPSVTKAEYPHYEQQSAMREMRKPFDKNSASITGTSTHPHSQIKPLQKQYFINGSDVHVVRDVKMYDSDFKSSLPQHPPTQKYTNFVTQYKGKYPATQDSTLRNRTQSQYVNKQVPAGNYRQVQLQEAVKPITTLFCQQYKEKGDQKEKTATQRSWLPQKDKAVSFSMGKTAEEFKKGSIPKNDIQTSLNMNIGVHNLQPVGVADGYFRHVRTITTQPNKTFCSRP